MDAHKDISTVHLTRKLQTVLWQTLHGYQRTMCWIKHASGSLHRGSTHALHVLCWSGCKGILWRNMLRKVLLFLLSQHLFLSRTSNLLHADVAMIMQFHTALPNLEKSSTDYSVTTSANSLWGTSAVIWLRELLQDSSSLTLVSIWGLEPPAKFSITSTFDNRRNHWLDL